MDAQMLFSIANLIALAGWVGLAAFPRRPWVAEVLCGRVLPAAFAASYVAIVGAAWGASEGGFSSLAEVGRLFDDPWMLLAGWIHYLAFDLFVGSWMAQDARRRGLRHLLVVPCLALTFLFGPAGLLSYLALRAVFNGAPEPARQAT